MSRVWTLAALCGLTLSGLVGCTQFPAAGQTGRSATGALAYPVILPLDQLLEGASDPRISPEAALAAKAAALRARAAALRDQP